VRNALSIEELRDIYARIAARYDFQHALVTARADQRGRTLLVDKSVGPADNVLDCGSGTGTTGILAARKAGPHGKVTFFDLSDAMLAVARQKALEAGLQDRAAFLTGDIVHLPFDDGEFDVVLSTYSMCPLYDPAKGALELYRVTRPGGKIGVAHSAEPGNPIIKWLADRVEDWAWRLPSLSMGCRSVEVLPTLKRAGGKVLFSRRIGVPLWPFFVFVVEKPAS
jgi:demethylmenaquinone methyltransferase / 2-methoxy-6-polyprenyl-1,4-benzoquinol methylase